MAFKRTVPLREFSISRHQIWCAHAIFVQWMHARACKMPSCLGSVPQDFLSQRVMSEDGMVQGFWSASGARARKRCIWNRERSSAISFETPGTWLVRTTKLCFIQRRTTRLTKSIMRGFLECPEFLIDTTDKLSHQNWRRFPARSGCYMAQATTMGKSSYHSKLIPCCWFNCMCRGQRPSNHFPWKYPPKPIEPAASVYSSRFWAGVGVDLRKKERPGIWTEKVSTGLGP